MFHILWTGAVLDKNATARNAVFYGDKAIDRCLVVPVLLHEWRNGMQKENLKKGDEFIHESIIGSQFIGRIEEETTIAGKPAIIPSIEGWAMVYGYNTIIIDDDDPYAYGFQVI